MNKSELIKTLADSKNISIEESTDIINYFFEAIKIALLNGDRVEIRRFGSFKLKYYKGYKGRNPKSGQPVNVAPKRLPFFRPGKEFKEYLNS